MRWLLGVAAALALAAPAQAATYCVATSTPGCDVRASVADALDAAAEQDGTDTIRIGPHTEAGSFSDDGGEAVRIVGSGRGATVLAGRVDLGEDASAIAGVTVRGSGGTALALRGSGQDVAVEGDVRLRDGAALRSSGVAGTVTAAGDVAMHSVAAGGIAVESGALTARNVTVRAGVTTAGAGRVALTDSVVLGSLTGTFALTRSLVPGGADPRLGPDLVPRASSPAVDAGDPAPLAATEPLEDARGAVRAMDGDDDGTAQRDIGAFERRPPAPPDDAGNLLANPNAEQGTAATDDRASPPPPHWTRTGAFTSVRYGTVSGAFAFPSLEAAITVRGGRAFFAAGPGRSASLRQVVDVARWAPEIDARSGARMRLSALLGGFRASEDHAVVFARFLDAFGRSRKLVRLDTVTAAERGNATMLTPRLRVADVPRLTRAVAVYIRAGVPGGSYNDAYVDDVALVPRIATLRGLLRPRIHAPRRFAGAAVLSPRVRVNRRRLARVRVGCPNATFGSCSGIVTLARRRSVILGARRIALRPGQIRRLRMQLSRRERRRLGRRTTGHVYVAVRDRQGLTRTVTAPVRIVPR
ncbi:MAG TPA: choice-of-anchor Q domain-containing protein [Solirubrobacteraceae bacterium]|nr:choice-of-anchor Q domain-containing protein [Solirubrobacteraceae bacterium]